MSKEESINKLKEFLFLIHNYRNNQHINQEEEQTKINKLLPVVQDLVQKANCLKLISINPPPIINANKIDGINPFDAIFTDFWGTNLMPEIKNMTEQALSKYENNMVDIGSMSTAKQQTDGAHIVYPDKITLKWIFENVPVSIYIRIFGPIITAAFFAGYYISKLLDKY